MPKEIYLVFVFQKLLNANIRKRLQEEAGGGGGSRGGGVSGGEGIWSDFDFVVDLLGNRPQRDGEEEGADAAQT